MKVAFDIDKTLWLVDNERGKNFPNHELVNVLKWFHKNGDEVFVLSTGGEDYAKEIVEKIGIADLVSIITKPDFDKCHPDMDIAFDDSEKNLAKINILVKDNFQTDDTDDYRPKTIREAIERCFSCDDSVDLELLFDAPKERLDWVYRNLKQSIIKVCELNDNSKLINACNSQTSDDAARVIIEALWKHSNPQT